MCAGLILLCHPSLAGSFVNFSMAPDFPNYRFVEISLNGCETSLMCRGKQKLSAYVIRIVLAMLVLNVTTRKIVVQQKKNSALFHHKTHLDSS